MRSSLACMAAAAETCAQMPGPAEACGGAPRAAEAAQLGQGLRVSFERAMHERISVLKAVFLTFGEVGIYTL